MTTHDHNRMSPQEEILFALVEGELDPAREAAVLASLDAVAVARLEKMSRQRSLLRRVGEVAAPAGLVDRAMAVLEREAITGPSISDDAIPADSLRIEQYQPRATGLWQRRLAIAAGLALLVGGAGYWALRFAGTPRGVTGLTGPIAAGPAPSESRDTAPHTLASHDPAPTPAPDIQPSKPDPTYAIADHQPAETAQPYALPVDFGEIDDDDDTAIASAEPSPEDAPPVTTDTASTTTAIPVTLGVFSDMPDSLDVEQAARLAEEGRLVIRVRADRPALAAARLLSQSDSHANKGRLWRLMPCPPPDFSEATEAALPAPRNADDTVPYGGPMRPIIETTLSIEMDPSASSIAMIQAELEIIARGAVILDVLDRPVTMAPPCGEEGSLRGWTTAPTGVVHSVVVPLVVESNE